MWIRWCWVWLMGRNDLEGYQERNGLLEMWPSSRRHISLTFILYANAWPLWNHGKESNIQRNSQVEGEWGRKQGVKWQFYNGVRLHPFIEARGGGRWHQKESTFFTSSISEKLIPLSPTASILIIISRVLNNNQRRCWESKATQVRVQTKKHKTKKTQNINFCPWLLLRGVIIFLLLERTETLGILQLVDVFYGVAEPRGSKHIKRYICIVHWISIKWWAALTTFKSILPRSSLRWKNLEVRRLEISSNLVS